MPVIRVLVVEDSLTVRRRIVDVLEASPETTVVGEAADGAEAIELCKRLKPDVITLDMILPVMSGLAATEYIMAHHPTPILIVSSSTNRGELFKTYEALAAGAVDVLEKPRGDEPEGEWERKLINALRVVARIRVITHLRAKVAARATTLAPPAPRTTAPPPPGAGLRVIGIGASTGGPGAVVALLHALPSAMRVPILLVIHLSEPFAQSFADWLDGQTARRVRYARGGELLADAVGVVLLAPPGHHLTLVRDRIVLHQGPERHFCRPSVDVLFESLVTYGGSTAACLLTGMGRDGAQGLRAIRDRGGFTMAQDEGSCVVYGMPREAALLDAADRVLTPADMGAALGVLAEGGEP